MTLAIIHVWYETFRGNPGAQFVMVRSVFTRPIATIVSIMLSCSAKAILINFMTEMKEKEVFHFRSTQEGT